MGSELRSARPYPEQLMSLILSVMVLPSASLRMTVPWAAMSISAESVLLRWKRWAMAPEVVELFHLLPFSYLPSGPNQSVGFISFWNRGLRLVYSELTFSGSLSAKYSQY